VIPSDWTRGPAKWGAVVILGAACIGGLAWSVLKGLTPWRSSATMLIPTVKPSNPPPSAPTLAAIKININTANRTELELLPSVGPALADRIILERERIGLFKRIEDLGRVKGIGPKTIEKLRPLIRLE